MPRLARKQSKTGVYHLMWRGVNRQDIFHDDTDRIKFLELLQKYKANHQLMIFAWCLMSNHVHILLKEGNEKISATMKRLGVSYVRYYNWKYRTTGHLFQDSYNSEPVENNQYLFTVIRYIHQNPLKAGMVNNVAEWKWSSYCGYYSRKSYPKDLLDKDPILLLFSQDRSLAIRKFKEFNEKSNNDKCLDDLGEKTRLTDEEARIEIKKVLGATEIAHVKTLPVQKRNEVLRRIKKIEGLSLRHASRIIGVSTKLIWRA